METHTPICMANAQKLLVCNRVIVGVIVLQKNSSFLDATSSTLQEEIVQKCTIRDQVIVQVIVRIIVGG